MIRRQKSPPSAQSSPPTPASTVAGRWRLAGVILCVAVLWGIVFPAISETKSQRAAVKQLEERGIDPMALFYTDHPSTSERLLLSPDEQSDEQDSTTHH